MKKRGQSGGQQLFKRLGGTGQSGNKGRGALRARPRGEGGGKMGALAQRSAARGDQQRPWPSGASGGIVA
jgi:hypothetical protein